MGTVFPEAAHGVGNSLSRIIIPQDLRHLVLRAGEDDPAHAAVPVIGEGGAAGVHHLLAEEVRDSRAFLVRDRKIQDHAGAVGLFGGIRQKIEHGGVSLDPQPLLDEGLLEKAVNLLCAELPHPVNLLAVQQALIQIIPQGPGGKAGHDRQLVQIISLFHCLSPV